MFFLVFSGGFKFVAEATPGFNSFGSSVPYSSALTSSLPLSTVSGLAGQTVFLSCRLSQDTCGSIHSIKWYKGDKRVYIFSEIGAISRAEDDLADRYGFLTFISSFSQCNLFLRFLFSIHTVLFGLGCRTTLLSTSHCICTVS